MIGVKAELSYIGVIFTVSHNSPFLNFIFPSSTTHIIVSILPMKQVKSEKQNTNPLLPSFQPPIEKKKKKHTKSNLKTKAYIDKLELKDSPLQ